MLLDISGEREREREREKLN